MTAQQYRAALAALGLSQCGAARLLGLSDITGRRWAANGVTGPAAILLRLLLTQSVSIEDIQNCGEQ